LKGDAEITQAPLHLELPVVKLELAVGEMAIGFDWECQLAFGFDIRKGFYILPKPDGDDILLNLFVEGSSTISAAVFGLVNINAGGPGSHFRIRCQVGGSLIGGPAQVLKNVSSYFSPSLEGTMDIHLASVWVDTAMRDAHGK